MIEKRVSFRELRQRSVRGFAGLAFELLLVFGGFSFILHQESIDQTPKFLRTAFEWNEKIWTGLSSLRRGDVGNFKKPAKGAPFRVNGNVGIEDPPESTWTMKVNVPLKPSELEVTLNDIKKLPKTEFVNQFKCIEGWSEVVSFSGVKFIDFLQHYNLGTHSGDKIDINRPEDWFSHVGLETPDGEYYVSIDMKSMLSAETLLAYEMNGEALTAKHGAPLRLAIPNKYGVKNIKRIGRIRFADSKLPDYWGERGYDWFIGL